MPRDLCSDATRDASHVKQALGSCYLSSKRQFHFPSPQAECLSQICTPFPLCLSVFAAVAARAGGGDGGHLGTEPAAQCARDYCAEKMALTFCVRDQARQAANGKRRGGSERRNARLSTTVFHAMKLSVVLCLCYQTRTC